MTEEVYTRKPRTGLYALIAVIVAALIAGYFLLNGGDDSEAAEGDGPNAGQTINIVGFAVPEAANKAIAGAFTKTEDGRGVKFKTSYGASGDQSRAVEGGLKADYVHFSVATDVDRLVKAGLVDANYDQGENKGIVSSSIVVLGVRKGNPKNIQGWDDVIQPGIEIVTPNPASSGAARWNALAAWGHIAANGGTDTEAEEFVEKVFANVVSLPNSGRDATTTFLSGTGDVLLAYENETILATQDGEELDWVIPETSILIENPGAVLIDAHPKATEWLDFVLSEEGQRQFALTGFRPIIDGLEVTGIEGAKDPDHPFPDVPHLLTVEDDFESWDALSKRFFDEADGIITKIIAASGKAS